MSSVADSAEKPSWLAEHYRNHPLVGKIWSSQAQKFVTEQALIDEIGKARFVLLGETHTNKDHHQLQARFVGAFAQSKPVKPRIVFEMIPQSLGKPLNEYRARHPENTAKLGDVLKWQARGWGDWADYRPIFDVAYKYGLAIFPGNLDQSVVGDIARNSKKALDARTRTQLSLNITYTKPQSQALLEMLYESHCKFVPKSSLGGMKTVQQARDGKMASAMLAAPANGSAILIAGAGHVRNDWAVPRVLRARDHQGKIVSVAFVEITPDHKMPQEYEPPSTDKRPVYDYLYFTPKSEIKDHCAELAKRFKKHKTK